MNPGESDRKFKPSAEWDPEPTAVGRGEEQKSH